MDGDILQIFPEVDKETLWERAKFGNVKLGTLVGPK
jgi:hypothetical protein